MKKTTIIILTLVIALVFSACGSVTEFQCSAVVKINNSHDSSYQISLYGAQLPEIHHHTLGVDRFGWSVCFFCGESVEKRNYRSHPLPCAGCPRGGYRRRHLAAEFIGAPLWHLRIPGDGGIVWFSRGGFQRHSGHGNA